MGARTWGECERERAEMCVLSSESGFFPISGMGFFRSNETWGKNSPRKQPFEPTQPGCKFAISGHYLRFAPTAWRKWHTIFDRKCCAPREVTFAARDGNSPDFP